MRAAPTCVAVKLGRFSRPNHPMTDRRAFVKSVAGVVLGLAGVTRAQNSELAVIGFGNKWRLTGRFRGDHDQPELAGHSRSVDNPLRQRTALSRRNLFQ
jgi:hypothetical protein